MGVVVLGLWDHSCSLAKHPSVTHTCEHATMLTHVPLPRCWCLSPSMAVAQQGQCPGCGGTAAPCLPMGLQPTLKSLSTVGLPYGWKSRSDVLLVNANELSLGWHFYVDSWLKESPPQSNQPVSSKGMRSAQEWRVMTCPWSYCYLRFY